MQLIWGARYVRWQCCTGAVRTATLITGALLPNLTFHERSIASDEAPSLQRPVAADFLEAGQVIAGDVFLQI